MSTWLCYQLVFRAESDVCLGFDRLGFVQRTRYFIPAHNFWAAATVALAHGSDMNYGKAGTEAEKNLRFTPFYVWRNSEFVFPWNDPAKFERTYVGARTRATIESSTATAAEGGLFELEYLISRPDGEQLSLSGYAWVRQTAQCDLAGLLRFIAIGGERKYGWGRLRLTTLSEASDVFGHAMKLDEEEPRVTLDNGTILPAHLCVAGCKAAMAGDIEPLTGRTWDAAKGPGRAPANAPILCWAPGTQIAGKMSATVGPKGVWQACVNSGGRSPEIAD